MCANKRARRSSTSVRNIAMLFVPGTLMTAIRRHNCSLFVSFRFSSVGRKLVASCANSNVCSSRLLCNSSRMPFLRSVVCERWISRSSLDNRRISSCSILANLSIQYASTWTKGALDRAAASWTVTGVNFVKNRSSAASLFSPSPPRTTPEAVIFKRFLGMTFRNSSAGSFSNLAPAFPPPPPPLARLLPSGSFGGITRFLRFTLFAKANALSSSLFFANASPLGISANSELCTN